MSISLNKPRWLGRGALALVAGAAFLASISTPARAVMLPGSALFGYYDTGEDLKSAQVLGVPDPGVGDNILTLVSPNGNGNISFGRVQNSCALIYVFDDDQEMGECCGCPLTPAGILTFSVEHNLTSNWAITAFDGRGTIAIRTSTPLPTGCPSFANPGTISPACNGGCDPTISNTGVPTLLGSIIHVQEIDTRPTLTEVSLFDDGTGDTMNNQYLFAQCAAIVGNGSGGGICTCPTDTSLGLID